MKATNDEVTLWRQRIDSWRESGLKQSVWCRQNHVKASQFWYWKKKLAPATAKTSQREKNKTPEQEVEHSPFVPVTMIPAIPASETTDGLSIELPNGVKVSGILASNVALTKTLVEALI